MKQNASVLGAKMTTPSSFISTLTITAYALPFEFGWRLISITYHRTTKPKDATQCVLILQQPNLGGRATRSPSHVDSSANLSVRWAIDKANKPQIIIVGHSTEPYNPLLGTQLHSQHAQPTSNTVRTCFSKQRCLPKNQTVCCPPATLPFLLREKEQGRPCS